MFSFENLNHSKKTMKENINLDNMTFVNIKDFIGQELPVDGFFFTTSKFGEQVVICSGDKKVNIPSRYADTSSRSVTMMKRSRLFLTDILHSPTSMRWIPRMERPPHLTSKQCNS